jgi:hypothetical protein
VISSQCIPVKRQRVEELLFICVLHNTVVSVVFRLDSAVHKFDINCAVNRTSSIDSDQCTVTDTVVDSFLCIWHHLAHFVRVKAVLFSTGQYLFCVLLAVHLDIIV